MESLFGFDDCDQQESNDLEFYESARKAIEQEKKIEKQKSIFIQTDNGLFYFGKKEYIRSKTCVRFPRELCL